MGALLILLYPVTVLLACIGIMITLSIREGRRFRRLAAERPGETICHFARSLDYRRLDTRIIRSVYEGLHLYLGQGWPVRASDDLDETYRIDRDDGYTADLSRDTVLDFATDGSLIVTTVGERVVEGRWEL